MNSEFLDSIDIANHGLVAIGEPKINSVDEDSKANDRMSFAYGKQRQIELRANLWRHSIRKVVLRAIDTDTRRLNPNEWNEDTLYLPGAIVKDSNGVLWSSDEPANQGNEPGSTAVWDQYFGPLSVSLYDSTTTYHAGELVYVPVGSGGFVVFRSLINSNADDPTTVTDWDTTETYDLGAVVNYSGTQYRSLIVVNSGITPAAGPGDWSAVVTYSAAQTVTGSDGYIYSSIAGSNTNHDPVTTTGYWTNTAVPNAWASAPEQYDSSSNWAPVYAGLKNLRLLYPAGAGPSSQIGSKNVFLLPSGWLRDAPQNPGAGPSSSLGGPTYLGPTGWEFMDEFLVAPDAGPLLYRFGADTVYVPKMDPLFCAALAFSMLALVVMDLTQQTNDVQTAVARYNTTLGIAKLKNAIEVTKSQEPEEDDYLMVRL